jgi:hypothetical protein
LPTARPPTRRASKTVAWSWRAGDTIPLGYKTLCVVDLRDEIVDEDPVLVVEDVSR